MDTLAIPPLLAEIPWAETTLYGLWLALYVLLLFSGATLNLFGLAGNWVMTGAVFLHYFIAAPGSRSGTGLWAPILLLALSLAGEGLEALAGLLGAGKSGGSKRAMVLSMIGGIAGSLFGFSIGNAFLPLIGGIVGIVLVAGLGALAGAVLGETWKGRSFEESMAVGRGAFAGRILGTLAKSFLGALILVIALLVLIF